MRQARWLVVFGLLGCSVDVDSTDAATPDTDTDTGLGPLIPTWDYATNVDEGQRGLPLPDGTIVARLNGLTWVGNPHGPTLVAENEHRVRFSVTNQTSNAIGLEVDGVDAVETPEFEPGGTNTHVFLTTEVPGVYLWRVADEERFRRGGFGVVTVRDEAEYDPLQIVEQLNLVLMEPLDAEIDTCVYGQTSTDSAADTGAACPSWSAAPDGFTALVPHRLLRAYFPEGVRHGGPPNEFLVSTPAKAELRVREGTVTRINVINATTTTRTLDLGGLPAPLRDGTTPATLTLGPGEGTHMLSTAFGPVGQYTVRCSDCDPDGPNAVIIEIYASGT